MNCDIDFDFFDSPGENHNTEHHGDHRYEGKETESQNDSGIVTHSQGGAYDMNSQSSNTKGRKASGDDSHSNQIGSGSKTTSNNQNVAVIASVPSGSSQREKRPHNHYKQTSSHSDSESTDSDKEDGNVNFRVSVMNRKPIHSNGDSFSTVNSENTSATKLHRKPPLPSKGKSKSAWNDNKNTDAKQHKYEMSSSIDAQQESVSGSSCHGSDGRKSRKGQSRYSDKVVSGSESSSEEEETVRIRGKRRRRPQEPNLKIEIGDLSPRRSGSRSSSGRSRSNSSNWSTDSEEGEVAIISDRPTTRLTHRRSSSSDSSITVSSLSDNEEPQRKSQDVSSPKRRSAHFSDTVDKDRLNLELLLSALLEDDANNSRNSGQDKYSGRSPTQPKPVSKSKANYTFTSNRAKMIDLENQRLLNNIMAQRAAASKAHRENSAPSSRTVSASEARSAGRDRKSKTRARSPQRITNATVNRMRDQQRIERENLALLRRLDKIKPSADVSRTKNLSDYQRQMSYHCPELRSIPEFGDMPSQRSRSSMSTNSAYSQGSGHGRPVSAGYARPSSGTLKKSVRPASATSRPMRPVSATTQRPASAGRLNITTTKKRPEWQSGW